MRKLISVIIFIGLFFCNTTANASLLSLSERDWLSVGDGLITYDSSSTLEWLDLTQTVGNSIVQTESEAYFTDGTWRWATHTELSSLFSHISNDHSPGYRNDPNLLILNTQFVSFFGDTNPYATYSSGYFRVDVKNIPNSSPNFVSGMGSIGTSSFGATVSLTSENQVCGNCDLNFSSSVWGSWLVRDTAVVPLPPAIYLFIAGLLSMVTIRKRA